VGQVQIARSRLFGGRNKVPESLVGRNDELRALDAAWLGNGEAWQDLFNRNADKDRKLMEESRVPRVVVFQAGGGIGKTSVVARWAADTLAKLNHGGTERYFDGSFYSQGTRCEGDVTAQATLPSPTCS